ncbi:MAG: response regulator transcription factor [Acidimicrobiales bacterium]
MGQRILVIEDERDIAELVATRLRSEGYEVDACGDGVTGVRRCIEWGPDLVVLDLMLPLLDGLDVCRRIQQHERVPVVMLTAKDHEADMLVGLGVGADDYMTKPFSPRELAARIEAVLRRVGKESSTSKSTAPAFVIDRPSRTVQINGADVHLTVTEFDLLQALVEADGVVLSRDELLYKVWGYRDASGERTVDSHVRALRRKLGDDLIRTVHGVGYAMTVGAQSPT